VQNLPLTDADAGMALLPFFINNHKYGCKFSDNSLIITIFAHKICDYEKRIITLGAGCTLTNSLPTETTD
jgi:hypothetical protein